METKAYQQILKSQLSKRAEKNPLFSLRSFAKVLQVSPGILSEVMNGKKALSYKMAEKFVINLDLQGELAKEFLNSVVENQKARKLFRKDPKIKNFTNKPFDKQSESFSYMTDSHYKIMGDWWYGAMLEATRLENYEPEPQWFASKMGISTYEAKLAMERLLEAKLLAKEGDSVVATNEQVRIKEMYSATTVARKKKQKQIREKAIEAIDLQPLEKRSMTTMTMSIDPEKIPEAKKMIAEFNEKLTAFLESGDRKEVYALEVGLFSLEKKE